MKLMMGTTSEPSQGVQEGSAPGQALLRPFPLVGLSNPQQRARRWPWGPGALALSSVPILERDWGLGHTTHSFPFIIPEGPLNGVHRGHE